jgi:hypothetical protein
MLLDAFVNAIRMQQALPAPSKSQTGQLPNRMVQSTTQFVAAAAKAVFIV